MGEQAPTWPPPPLGPVLVVDDDPRLREGLARILRSKGHAVIAAGDGAAALDLMRAYAPGLVIRVETLLTEMTAHHRARMALRRGADRE